MKKLVELYKIVGKESGFKKEDLKVGSHSWGFIAQTDEIAKEKYWHPTKVFVDRIAKDRANWIELKQEAYEHMISETGAMFVGSPETVAKKMIWFMEELQINRFMLHLPVGSMPHEDVLNAIELFGTKVAPIVREYFKDKTFD